MLKRILGALLRGKRWLVTLPLVALAGFSGFEAARYQLFYHGFSRGSRTGVVRKLSVKRSQKGMPFCTYVSVEMVMPGAQPGINGDLWIFSVDDDTPKSPVVARLRAAEKSAERITVDYRQDLHRWWSCAESEYYVTSVE
jgi:hypothetical protein